MLSFFRGMVFLILLFGMRWGFVRVASRRFWGTTVGGRFVYVINSHNLYDLPLETRRLSLSPFSGPLWGLGD